MKLMATRLTFPKASLLMVCMEESTPGVKVWSTFTTLFHLDWFSHTSLTLCKRQSVQYNTLICTHSCVKKTLCSISFGAVVFKLYISVFEFDVRLHWGCTATISAKRSQTEWRWAVPNYSDIIQYNLTCAIYPQGHILKNVFLFNWVCWKILEMITTQDIIFCKSA